MDESGLQPGGLVFDLQAVARSGGAVAGLLAAPLAAALSGWPWYWCVVASLASAIIGLIIGAAIGRVLFPAPPGQTTVTPARSNALGPVLRAAIGGASVVAVLASAGAFIGGGGIAACVTILAGFAGPTGVALLATHT